MLPQYALEARLCHVFGPDKVRISCTADLSCRLDWRTRWFRQLETARALPSIDDTTCMLRVCRTLDRYVWNIESCRSYHIW